MAIEKIQIAEFLNLSKNYPVFDVRSPLEFSHAHIPGAYNLPLFDDEQRKIVGTTKTGWLFDRFKNSSI